MKAKTIVALKEQFEEIINSRMSLTYELGERPVTSESTDDFYFVIKPHSLMWEDDFVLVHAFAILMHRCFRYDVSNKEFHVW